MKKTCLLILFFLLINISHLQSQWIVNTGLIVSKPINKLNINPTGIDWIDNNKVQLGINIDVVKTIYTIDNFDFNLKIGFNQLGEKRDIVFARNTTFEDTIITTSFKHNYITLSPNVIYHFNKKYLPSLSITPSVGYFLGVSNELSTIFVEENFSKVVYLLNIGLRYEIKNKLVVEATGGFSLNQAYKLNEQANNLQLELRQRYFVLNLGYILTK